MGKQLGLASPRGQRFSGVSSMTLPMETHVEREASSSFATRASCISPGLLLDISQAVRSQLDRLIARELNSLRELVYAFTLPSSTSEPTKLGCTCQRLSGALTVALGPEITPSVWKHTRFTHGSRPNHQNCHRAKACCIWPSIHTQRPPRK
jgi:hypothetical protein